MGYRVLIYSLAGRQDDYSIGSVFGRGFRIDALETNLSEESNLGWVTGCCKPALGALVSRAPGSTH